MRRLAPLLILPTLAGCDAAAPLAPDPVRGRVVRVVDGDTLHVRVDGRREKVRVLGIDTPESGECGYKAATKALASLVDGRRVALITDPSQDRRDRYGRLLAYVEASGRDAGRALVRQGWAEVYVFRARFERTDDYRTAARAARRERRGVYGSC